jgi:heat shock protein HslJ
MIRLLFGLMAALPLAACTAEPPARVTAASTHSLAGSRWTLIAFQSSDDAMGRVVPPSAERYVAEFRPDGTLAMQLDCNRATGRWEAPTPSTGSLRLSGGAMTRAMCQQGALDTQIARDLARVRSYIIRDGRLFLSLETDSGIYEWRRI